jgi:hypothetical protein
MVGRERECVCVCVCVCVSMCVCCTLSVYLRSHFSLSLSLILNTPLHTQARALSLTFENTFTFSLSLSISFTPVEHPPIHTARTLTLIAKTIQNTANLVGVLLFCVLLHCLFCLCFASFHALLAGISPASGLLSLVSVSISSFFLSSRVFLSSHLFGVSLSGLS